MIQSIYSALLWFSAIGCGLMAGLYFAFSAFIMTALARVPLAHGVSAMQSINAVFLKSPFMPLFYGTTLASLALAGIAFFDWSGIATTATMAAGIIYILGMFVCTLAFNVPLNKMLDAIDSDSAEAAPAWARYLKDWTFWNHLRTVASTVACALFMVAIVAR